MVFCSFMEYSVLFLFLSKTQMLCEGWTTWTDYLKEFNLFPWFWELEIKLSWCFATSVSHSKVPVSKLSKIYIVHAKARRSELFVDFYIRVVAWVTIEDGPCKFLILRKHSSYWFWVGGVLCFFLCLGFFCLLVGVFCVLVVLVWYIYR